MSITYKKHTVTLLANYSENISIPMVATNAMGIECSNLWIQSMSMIQIQITMSELVTQVKPSYQVHLCTSIWTLFLLKFSYYCLQKQTLVAVCKSICYMLYV